MGSTIAALKANPVRVYSIITAAIAVAAAFGLNISADQTAALVGLAVVLLGGGEVVRARVSPVVGAAEVEPTPPTNPTPEKKKGTP